MSKKLIYVMTFWVLLGLLLPSLATAESRAVGVAYRGHIQDRGDYPLDGSWVDSPELIGTVGQSKRIEGFLIKLGDDLPMELSIRYNVHVQNRGWLYDENDPTDWPKDGDYAGTRGESLRIEAVKIMLTDSAGKPVTGYSVQYRGHVQNLGDQPQAADCWLADGDQLGTVGSSLRLEALLVRVVQNKTDLTAYNALVAKIAKLNEDDFTDPSWAQLQTALKEHAVTADLPQAEVDAAVVAIQAAYDGLEDKIQPTVYDKAGIYGPASGAQTIDGDVSIAADGVILQNLQITGELLISEAVGKGTVTLNNVTVDGDTLVRGGGANSIHINGGQYSRIVMEKTASGAVRIVAKDVDGLEVVIAEDATGETIILEGAFDSVLVNAPNMTVTTQGNTTTIGKMTVGAAGVGSSVTLNAGTTVNDLVLDGKAAIKGQGTVVKAEVRADGVVFDKKPASYTVEPGVVIPPVFPSPSDGGGGYNPPAPVAVTGVSLDQANLSLGVARTAQLNATVLPSNAANKTVTWTSSDDTIATVDATGKVTGKKEGPVTISVKTLDGNKTASCTVTVTTSFEVTQIADGTAVITGMNGSSKVILIPETIDGVTISGIGDQAFYNRNITSIEIPKTVKTIGFRAFYNCLNLTTVIFTAESGLETIGEAAFQLDHNISKITIPKSVKVISDDAFSGCTQLNEVIFADDSSLETIGNSAFASIGATNLTLPASLNTIGDRAFFGCSLLETITISNGVTAIPVEAFAECRGLTAVTLPSGLTAIGAGAFNNCDKMINITIPKGVNSIGDAAFGYDADKVPASRCYTFRGDVPTTLIVGALPTTAPTPTIRYYANYGGYDGWTGYTKVHILATPTQLPVQIGNSYSPFVTVSWNTVAGATGYEVFYSDTSGSYPATADYTTSGITATITGLDSTKTYYFVVKARDADGESLWSNEMTADMSVAVIDPANIDNGVITAYTGPGGAVVIPEQVGGKTITGIGADAFKGKTNVTSVTIPQTVTSIGDNAFMNCSRLASLTFAGTSQLTAIGDKAFQGCQELERVSLPGSVKTIGASGFMQCKAMTSLDLGSVETIGANAFYECTGLVNLTIPNSLTSIGTQAFCYCTGLKTVEFLGGSKLQTLQGASFFQCSSLETVTFAADNRIEDIKYATFQDCSKLKQVNFSSALLNFGYNAFSGCPGSLVLRFDGNAPGSRTDAAIPGGTTIAYWEDKTGFTPGAWPGCTLKLRNTSLTQTAVTINTASFSFDAQDGATEVKLQKKIHTDSAWIDATTTEALISASTIATATGLTPGISYDFRLWVTGGNTPGPSTVVNLTTLVAVTGITLNKTSLELSTNGSETLTAIVEPGDAANRNLNWTTSDKDVATVDGNGLVTAKKAGTATITATAADGGGRAAACLVTVLLYSVTVDGSEQVTITKYLGNEAAVSIPATIGGKPVVAIGDSAFTENNAVTSITISDGITSIGTAAFKKCENLTGVNIPGSVQSIGVDAFNYCEKLNVVNFSEGSNDLVIGKNAFYSDKSLTSISLPKNLIRLEEGAFHNCNNLATVHFATGSQLISIAKNGFSECPITSLTLPTQLQSIGYFSFYNNHLTGILTIPAAVISIDENAFERREGLATPPLDTLVIEDGPGLTIGSAAFKNQAFTTITIPDAVTINTTDDDTMGTNGATFNALYRPSGSSGNAGTYQYVTGAWSKD